MRDVAASSRPRRPSRMRPGGTALLAGLPADLACIADSNTNPLSSGFGLAAHIVSGTFAGHTITGVPLRRAGGLCDVTGGVNSLSVTLGVDVVTH